MLPLQFIVSKEARGARDGRNGGDPGGVITTARVEDEHPV